MENYRQNRQTLAGRFAALGPSRNPYKSNEQFNNDFKSEEGIDRLISNTKTYLGETYTKDQFIKKFACDKDSFKSSQYCVSQSTPESTQVNPIFSCIEKNKEGKNLVIKQNFIMFRVGEVYWAFNINGGWNQVKGGEILYKGKWKCDGESEYLIFADDGETYISKYNKWVKPNLKPKSDDSFPLKKGSEGPNVVKLQKFLNNKISKNPLTVNGVFDQKTQDKLIEFQKKEGIIE